MDELTKKIVKITAGIVIIIALLLIFTRKLSWAFGLLTGSVWAIINFLLTIKLFKMAVLEIPKTKLWFIILVKFPVLYLTVFLILIVRLFPLTSVMTGMSLILIIPGAYKLCRK